MTPAAELVQDLADCAFNREPVPLALAVQWERDAQRAWDLCRAPDAMAALLVSDAAARWLVLDVLARAMELMVAGADYHESVGRTLASYWTHRASAAPVVCPDQGSSLAACLAAWCNAPPCPADPHDWAYTGLFEMVAEELAYGGRPNHAGPDLERMRAVLAAMAGALRLLHPAAPPLRGFTPTGGRE